MLKSLNLLRRSLVSGTTVLTWLAAEATANAQGPLAQTGVAKTMVGWFLVLLAVGLGLLVVCRPNSRIGIDETPKTKKGK